MLSRVPEPELMLEEAQAEAYAKADFSQPHQKYVELCLTHLGPNPIDGWVLDLGCGPGDITFRFARAFPKARLVGVDGSPPMLRLATKAREQDAALSSRIEFVQGYLPQVTLPDRDYAAIISNSLLHHLPDAAALWQTIRRYGRSGTQVCIMDLRRPSSEAEAQLLADTYTGGEAPLLKRDFYNSLRAAFTPDEVTAQLKSAGLESFTVSTVSDRHMLVCGRL
jgi:ubiquinone/menaquinone biosynthesis C-methylase UbiE